MTDDIRAVIFDVGNCLWFQPRLQPDPENFDLQAAAVRPLFDAWGLAPPEPLEQLLADIWAAMEEGYAVAAERQTWREPSLPFLWRGALASHDVTVSEEQAIGLWRAAWIPVRHFGNQLYPDTLDVLAELKARGFRIGLCTNRPCTEDMLWPDLADFGLAPYVDAATCSGDTGYFKPHPAPFERAIASLDIEPARALMVGDGLEADVVGGKRAGMRTAWKLNGRYGLPPSPDADYTIHDLNELLVLPALGGPGPIEAASPTPHEDANEDRY